MSGKIAHDFLHSRQLCRRRSISDCIRMMWRRWMNGTRLLPLLCIDRSYFLFFSFVNALRQIIDHWLHLFIMIGFIHSMWSRKLSCHIYILCLLCHLQFYPYWMSMCNLHFLIQLLRHGHFMIFSGSDQYIFYWQCNRIDCYRQWLNYVRKIMILVLSIPKYRSITMLTKS
jgi:hypothetical protein